MKPFPRTLTISALLGLGVVAAPAQAQTPAPRGEYAGFAAFSLSRITTTDLDARLTAAGYPTFGHRGRGGSLGVYRTLSSGLMLGGEWNFMVIGSGHRQNRDVRLTGGYATLGLGYARELSPRLRVYPRIGLGAAGMGLWFGDAVSTTDGPATFDQALANPVVDPLESTFSQGSMGVDLGAGIEWSRAAGRGGPLVGLRLGYLATPFDQGWTRNSRVLSGAPRTTVAGPYVRVLVGWAKRRTG